MASTSAPPHPLHLLLPRLGTEEEFAKLREVLRVAGFHDEGICRRLGIASIADFQAKCSGRTTAIEIEQPIDVLIRLVLDGEFVRQEIIESKLAPGALEVLEGLQMLARDPKRPGELFSTITIYPAAGGLLLAGDRPGTPDGSRYWLPPDVVYPGAVDNTRQFLASLPQTPCEALLDVGTGSGVAALSAAARYAKHAWGVDIASRSVRFAEFNRRLNNIGNATFLEGDLYEPVRGLTFDRIVTHPPYVPAPEIKMIFSDGGQDGEQILRRIVEGLPAYLREGGRFYTLVLGADCDGEPFEVRLRKWLGEDQKYFDLILVSHSLRPPIDFVSRALAKGVVPLNDLKFWTETWLRRKVDFLFYGSVLMRRNDGSRPPVTERVQKGEGFRPEHQEWLLQFALEAQDPGFTEFLMSTHPSLAPDAELHVLHRLHEGSFAPEHFGVETKTPIQADMRCPSWMVRVVSRCDGKATWGEQFAFAMQEGWIAAATTPAEFAGLLAMLAGQGLLRLAERPLP